jgi:hypothetical protein
MPEQAVENAAELADGDYPKAEDFDAAVADDHYRAGPQSEDEVARIEAGGDQMTTTETMSNVSGQSEDDDE